MTKKQKEFFEYLTKLEELEKQYNRSYVEVALSEFYRYWKRYEKKRN